MKVLRKILVIAITSILLCGCTNTNAVTNVSKFLYKIERDGKIVYLLGSNHHGKKINELDSVTMDALSTSDRIVFEIDLDQSESSQDTGYLTLNNIAEVLTSSQIEKLDKLLKDYKFSSNAGLYNYNLMTVSSLCSEEISEANGYSSNYGIDSYLYNKAKSESKEIDWIESIDSQKNLITMLSKETPNYIINDLEYKKSEAYAIKFHEAYYSKDINEWNSFLEYREEVREKSEEAVTYNTYMVDNRNLVMVDYIDKAFGKNGTTFITVGVLHLFGENGILELLKGKGYIVDEMAQ